MKKYFMVYTVPCYSEWILDEPEFKILLACKVMHGLSTTNSDIKRISKVDMPASDIGIIMARLRAARLIDYRYVETGRKAVGSGRYELIYKADPFSMDPVLKGVAMRLPPLQSRSRW